MINDRLLAQHLDNESQPDHLCLDTHADLGNKEAAGALLRQAAKSPDRPGLETLERAARIEPATLNLEGSRSTS